MHYSTKTKLDIKAYERDNYTCRHCGDKRKVVAHHIIPGVEKLDNLISLCPACHKKEHGMSGCFKAGIDERRNCGLGSKNHQAKLTEEDVLKIKRQLYKKPIRHIAKEFSIVPRTVRRIRDGEIWAWLHV